MIPRKPTQGRTQVGVDTDDRVCFWVGVGFALVALAVLAWELMK